MIRTQPVAHHYLPIFYLSRWAGDDGRICRIQRVPGGIVKAKRVVPKGTGFEPRLYEARGAPPDRAQAMESEFMARVDAQAAGALRLLESGLPDAQWASAPRSARSRFLLTQMLRTPEDIARLKSSVREEWSKSVPQLQEAYTARRHADIPENVDDYLAKLGEVDVDDFSLQIGRRLMNHDRIGELINNMRWHVLELPPTIPPLVTSDRPVWMTITLTEPHAFISMPIGPRRLFHAAPAESTLQRLTDKPIAELARARSLLAIQHAAKFVYGVDEQALELAMSELGTRRHSTLLEQLAAKQGHRVIASDSPSVNPAQGTRNNTAQ